MLVVADPAEPDGLAHWRVSDFEMREGRVVEPAPLTRRPPFRVFTRCEASGRVRHPIERRALQLEPHDEPQLLAEPLAAQFERAAPWTPRRTDSL